jgi:flagellar basal-body rod protein FlgB
MIESLVTSSGIRMLEQTLNFTEQRHQVLVENIANASTPGYVQRDLSVSEFQNSLRDAVRRKRQSNTGAYEPRSGNTISFYGSSGVSAEAMEETNSVVFHDRGIRSMEYLMSEMADNAIAHNMAAQLLRGKYDSLSRAISMKV